MCPDGVLGITPFVCASICRSVIRGKEKTAGQHPFAAARSKHRPRTSCASEGFEEFQHLDDNSAEIRLEHFGPLQPGALFHKSLAGGLFEGGVMVSLGSGIGKAWLVSGHGY